MAEVEKTAVVPRLRFPEFIGQKLREVPLSDVTTESTMRNGDAPPVGAVMGVSKVAGIVPMEERIVASDISRYKVVKKDWFAYNPMRLNIGSIARWRGDADILVSPDYVVFQCHDKPDAGIIPSYLDHFRQSGAWDAFVGEGGDGGVRVRIYYKDLARFELALPKRAEQQKIADCLSSLDELIAAQGRKVEALKTYKRGLMQQLFPREGETRPRLRLPEFRDAPEWADEKLGKYVEIYSGGSPSSFTLSSSGAYPFVKVEDLNNCSKYQFTGREFADEMDGVIPKKSILFPKRGAAIELNKIRVTASEMQIDTNLMAISPKSGLTTEFLFYYLSNVGLAHIADTSTIPQINNKHIIPFSVRIPLPIEQQRIAECLTLLDDQIAAECEALDALKSHKSGLMQQLFPSLEEA